MEPRPRKPGAAVPVRINEIRARALLDKIDQLPAPAGAERRNDERVAYRRACLIELTQPTGNVVKLRVPTRNLSRGGLAFLHNSYIHGGTRCCVHLVNTHNRPVRVEGTVTRCEYLESGIHHVSVCFQQPIDVKTFCGKPQPPRVLLVDDDPQIRRLIQVHLKSTSAEISEAENGEQALEHAQAQRFDIILMDVEMPVMDGITALKTLRERGYNGRIVALTALTSDGDRDRLLDEGFDDYIGKPVNREALCEMVAQADEQPLFSTLEDGEGVAELINQFVTELGGLVSEIEKALAGQDRDTLARLSRTLKGNAGSYGFEPISMAARQVESHATQGNDSGELKRSVRQLTHLCRLVRKPS